MYISLHNRSAYSFGSALSLPEQLAQRAAELGMPAIALTDLDGLYAAVAFQQACERHGVRPIFGAELKVACEPRGRAGGACVSVTLLARAPAGYGNLCRLISLRHLGERPLACEEVSEHAEGLICLVGRGTVEAREGPAGGLRAPDRDGADLRGRLKRPLRAVPMCIGKRSMFLREDRSLTITALNGGPLFKHSLRCLLTSLRPAFGGRLYVSLAIHHANDAPIARARARLADELGLPVLAACESRCLRRDQAATLWALSSIGTLTLLDRPHPDKPVGAWHLRTPDEMARLFARRPDALARTLRVAEQCDCRLDLSRNRFPAFESPDGRSAIRHLRTLAYAGCRRRYVEQPPQRGIGGRRPSLAEALERVDRELDIIEQVHYAEYFLVFHEIVEHCRSRGIATLARGSAADSLVCYALGVSHACPFRFDLPFDRFINPERARFSKMADIDLDLPWDRRDEVIRWVYDRWGHDRVAMIGSANTFHARAAVAELGKVHGLPAHEVHQVTKRLPHVTSWDLPRAIARSPEARREVPIDGEPWRTILRMARDLEGLPRHWAMHPCGLVVSPEPLTDLVPVQRSPKGPLVAQYEMDPIEELGFVKVDLLGQAGLSVLRDSVAEVERTDGRRVDLETDVDYSEAATWEMIATGQARGVHHIESPAMTNLIRQCNCRDIDCLTALVAVIRPGASNQGRKDAFARRYQGLEPPDSPHPSVVAVLEKTYGLMVFEEHILQVAVEFAGMNIGRADVLRRALNREDRAMILEMRSEFRACALARGRTPEEIDRVWPLLQNFCGFMFNKAHSAEYAIEAFQGAWLKRRWPIHYLAAILSNYRGFYAHSPTLPQILYVLEAFRLGEGLLPPCVNRSRERFSVERVSSPARDGDGAPAVNSKLRMANGERCAAGALPRFAIRHSPFAIRVPVSHIKGLSEAFLERYLGERAKGPFEGLEQFLRRVRPGEAEARALLDSGALDGFGICRPELFWRLRSRLHGTRYKGVRPSTALLWEPVGDRAPAAPPISLTRPGPRQIARREMELLGFPVTLDPLTCLGSDEDGRAIDWARYVPVAELGGHVGRRVTVCGLMVADRINRTPAGELMKFVTLADGTGFVETMLFPDAYQRFGHLTVANPILAASGVVEGFENGNGFVLRVRSVTQPVRRRVENARFCGATV